MDGEAKWLRAFWSAHMASDPTQRGNSTSLTLHHDIHGFTASQHSVSIHVMAAVGTCVLVRGIRDGELGPAATELQATELVALLVQHEIPIVTLATAADGGGASGWDHPRWLQEDGDCGGTCTGREMLPDRQGVPSAWLPCSEPGAGSRPHLHTKVSFVLWGWGRDLGDGFRTKDVSKLPTYLLMILT